MRCYGGLLWFSVQATSLFGVNVFDVEIANVEKVELYALKCHLSSFLYSILLSFCSWFTFQALSRESTTKIYESVPKKLDLKNSWISLHITYKLCACMSMFFAPTVTSGTACSKLVAILLILTNYELCPKLLQNTIFWLTFWVTSSKFLQALAFK